MQSVDNRPQTTVPLLAVVVTSELTRRPRRAPDFEAESRALAEAARMLSASPGSILQRLAELAVVLCKAHSAGVTLLETVGTEPVLRWQALAGKFATHRGATLPRSFSPCGTTLDRDAIQLMSRPVRHFPYMNAWLPAIEETLLAPFRLNGKPLGTIWVVAHDDTRRFDSEDARLLASLSNFAALACELADFRAHQGAGAEVPRSAAIPIATAGTMDRFMAILGHEMRGLLQPAKNAVELLKRENLDAPTRRSVVEIVDRQIFAMTRLVGDLLDIARARNGTFVLRTARVRAAGIIEHAVETVRPLMAARGHTFVVELPSERLLLDADVFWLSSALQNLLGNAAKYTDPSGTIRIGAEREADDLVITVSDNGMGIAPAELETIFELYAQAGQGGTARSAGGIGLGLYLSRLVIEAHGGAIRASSSGAARGGSQFTVRVPLPAC
jgi:signal transduction histidine kinase